MRRLSAFEMVIVILILVLVSIILGSGAGGGATGRGTTVPQDHGGREASGKPSLDGLLPSPFDNRDSIGA